MRLNIRPLFVFLILISASAAEGEPILQIFPSPGPAPGSPSVPAYRDRALESLEQGVGSIGNRVSDPAAYSVVSQVPLPDLINSAGGGGPSFHSWMGKASPSDGFSSEVGTQLFFGLRILGNGEKFNISQISFDAVSTDTLHLFHYQNSNLFADTGYNASRVGVVYGADGSKVLINSGPASQLVDEFDYVGVALSLDATLEGGTDQQKLDSVATRIAGRLPFSIVGSYVISNPSGTTFGSASATVPVTTAVPESSWRPFILGVILLVPMVLISRRPRARDNGEAPGS